MSLSFSRDFPDRAGFGRKSMKSRRKRGKRKWENETGTVFTENESKYD